MIYRVEIYNDKTYTFFDHDKVKAFGTIDDATNKSVNYLIQKFPLFNDKQWESEGYDLIYYSLKVGDKKISLGSFDTQENSFPEIVNLVTEARKQKFKNEFHTVDFAPCQGSSIYNGQLCVVKFFNAVQGDIDLLPKRSDLVNILKALFAIGKGGIAEPTLLESMVILMYAYLLTRQKWLAKGLPIRNSAVDEVKFEDKLFLELQLMSIDTSGVIDMSDAKFQKFPFGPSVITKGDFVAAFGEAVWLELTKPLSDEELAQVFVPSDKIKL